MKKLIILVLFVLAYLTSYAQSERGTFQMGAGGFPIIYPDGTLPMGYALRANVGYFLTDNFTVGAMLFHGYVDYMKSSGVNVYARYYFLTKKISLFAEATTGLGAVKYDDSVMNGTMFSYTVGPGVGFAVNNKISIELLLQYARLRNISHPEMTEVGNTFIPTIGIQYTFRK